ncbi:2Fe-2S iron-sulfur cluster binding domain-containing protein [Mucilaginibacter dorajii]|uniref:2Fe-2S iron-sulfur cluster binding domain-containing protein n=2 Tax=Mucilaginibacter dorajii TaxID=692994 RepID=UPI0035B626DB
MENNTIHLTLYHLGESLRIQISPGQYHSLMLVISDHLAIPGFGLCCGMGSCGTCLVQIVSPYSKIGRNVLACDIPVNDDLANMIILVPDKTY